VEHWNDADKVLLVSLLTLPFALGWMLRVFQVEADPTLSPYVNRDFLPVLLPFLWIQTLGHVGLVLGALVLRRQRERRLPLLVNLEIQFWFFCMVFSLYTAGPFTSSFAVLVLALPVVGYQIFDPRPMNLGLATLLTGVTVAAVLPQLGVIPYAPFVAHAPFGNGRLHNGWIVSIGLPSIFATVVVLIIHVSLMRRLKERQAELERLSSTDMLTGLWNRGVFFRRLEEEVSRARRHGHPLCVVMLDVDHFKLINDNLGHLVGDEVLRQLGGCLKGVLRLDDVAARYGGEEFAVVMPHTSLVDAATVAERLRLSPRALAVGSQGAHAITVSLGVAQWRPDEGTDELVARADAALYASKHGGRDRVTCADAARPVSAVA
jgi:diguanylate cyclase (GGDEF)-like protein